MDYRKLYERYLAGQLTPEEHAALLLHFHRTGESTELRAAIESTFDAQPPESWEKQAQVQETFRRVGTNLREFVYQTKRTPSMLMRWLPYAAAILLVSSLAGWWAISDRQSVDNLAATEIGPGGNRATLTLADGRVVDLSSEQGGIVVQDGIAYLDGSSVLGETTGSQFYALTTPKGGTYSITLPDGSKAWLNSASRLKYPSRFNGNERVVEIEGEGYFEIVKDAKRPFKVRSEGQEIEVVGTEFNIYAYADEAETQTTLVAGAVRILNLDAKIIHALRPGQQASTRGAATTIHEVNVERYAAWKNGYFDFTDMTLQEVMRQLGRWYDLEVSYEGDIPGMEFYGTIERSTRLSTVMALLESNGFAYRLDGRELIVWHQKGGAR